MEARRNNMDPIQDFHSMVPQIQVVIGVIAMIIMIACLMFKSTGGIIKTFIVAIFTIGILYWIGSQPGGVYHTSYLKPPIATSVAGGFPYILRTNTFQPRSIFLFVFLRFRWGIYISPKPFSLISSASSFPHSFTISPSFITNTLSTSI